MPKTCIVKNCKSIGKKDSRINGLTFHRLPCEPAIRQKWLDNIRRVNKDGTPWVPYKSATVCSRHFKKSCFHGKILGLIDQETGKAEHSQPQTKGQGRKKYFRATDDAKADDKNETDDDAEEYVKPRTKKVPTQRRVLYPHAVPTEEMGIPSRRLLHTRPLPFPKRIKVCYF